MTEAVVIDLTLFCTPRLINGITRWQTKLQGAEPAASTAAMCLVSRDVALEAPVESAGDVVAVPTTRRGPVHAAEELIEELVSAGAVVGSAVSSVCDPLLRDGYSSSMLSALQECGVLSIGDSEFGDLSLQVDLSAIDWRLSVYVTGPCPLLRCDRMQSCSKVQRNKMELVSGLLQQGWEPVADPAHYTPGAMLHFPHDAFERPATLMLCLMFAAQIFHKGCGEIRMRQCDGYYKCRLRLTTLRDFHSHPQFLRFRNVHFEALANGKALPPLPEDAALPPPHEVLAIEGGLVDDVPAGELVPAAMLPAAGVFHIPPIKFEGATVVFDNCTHISGKRRAICVCAECDDTGGRCERSVFMQDYDDDKNAAAAFLFAWRKLGPYCCGDKVLHRSTDPEVGAADAIRACLLELPDM